jgi:superfamily II DNA or RNA helicase/HKD family nuclease
MSEQLTPLGLYERVLDEELAELLKSCPDITATLEKLDDESEVESYSQLIAHILRGVLPNTTPKDRLPLINRLIELLSAQDGLDYTLRRRLIAAPKTLLTQVCMKDQTSPLCRPETPLSISSLLTGSADDPPLEREIRSELQNCDRVDILVSFIKWSGLSLLLSAFEEIEERGIPVRIITTSYMGASDPPAIEWLASRRNVSMRISYDTERTRLHAKAYHFHRATGYSTAYIGSANMSRPAMTSGLEWTVKVTAQDMPHILDRFAAEFETYWRHESFVSYDPSQADRFRDAITKVRNAGTDEGPRFFADLKPHPFQERVIEALEAARLNGSTRNLVVAATGTGKTVMAAFDYAKFRRANPDAARLLFVVHRKEILRQARDCFRAVLRDFNFGDLLVDGQRPEKWEAVFASVQSLNQQKPWESLGADHFHYVIVDEAHHGAAPSYRHLFEHLQPKILLGLSATPERMDGTSILPDFDNRFAAEIRLPEALEEKLLCPFHYFGVTDPISTADDRFWTNGRYDVHELENIYTGDDLQAQLRLDAICAAIRRYHPDLGGTRAVGFCASVRHAEFMAQKFREIGYTAETILGETPPNIRDSRLVDFRAGKLQFLFVVDVLSEGIDVPEINLILFLRPTESLTVFLQQLGRGLRHAPEKECLTVLDFVGQVHRRYRIDRKLSALLRHTRRRIDREIERDFPNLPPGCSIQFERVAREHVLENISRSLGNLNQFVPEVIRTFSSETGRPLTFGNFINETSIAPVELLKNRTWSQWKDLAAGTETVTDPDSAETRRALRRFALRTDHELLDKVLKVTSSNVAEEPSNYGLSDREAGMLHYMLWSVDGRQLGVNSYKDSFHRWLANTNGARDLAEVIEWRRTQRPYPTFSPKLAFPCYLRIHAAYGLREITAAFGKANLETRGPAGTGVIHLEREKAYLHLVTFRKEERDFAPATRYKDYPVSPTTLHWESQSGTAQTHVTGQNYIHFLERGYTILFFARVEKRVGDESAPYVFLGPVKELLSHKGDRPIQMLWELEHAMPADLYEQGRTA